MNAGLAITWRDPGLAVCGRPRPHPPASYRWPRRLTVVTVLPKDPACVPPAGGRPERLHLSADPAQAHPWTSRVSGCQAFIPLWDACSLSVRAPPAIILVPVSDW